MTMDEIIEILDLQVRQQFEIEADDPDYGTDIDLFDYGYIDSLGAVALIDYIEGRFHCTITQKDISQYSLNTIQEIAELVAHKIG